MDPSETTASRVIRWIVLVVVVLGVVAYISDFDFARIWSAIGAGLATAGATFLIQSIVVDPILEKIRLLEYKIDRIDRQINRNRE